MSLHELHYRLARRARGLRPGTHAGSQRGDGLETITHVALLHARDPRRLDLLASARDPMRRLLVRSARQRSSITVFVLADLSASMGTGDGAPKMQMLADLTAALAWSAWRCGDAFAFFGGDARLRRDFVHAPGRERGAGAALAARLRGFAPGGAGSDGLLAAASLIARANALVFLVSDFHMPVARVNALLAALARHQVVPMVLVDSREVVAPRHAGIARLRDSETGEQRTVAVTPGLRERVHRDAAAHRERLSAVFSRHGVSALRLEDRFDADRITRHFHG